MAGTHQVNAIVAYAPDPNGPPGPSWKWETVGVNNDPADDEVLVELVATGVCHTDIVLTSVPPGALGVQYPKIVGHEGSGYVKAVGSKVTKVAVGDPVLLSFDSCKSCRNCKSSHPANCSTFDPLNYIGAPSKFKTTGSEDAWGQFFGQSSFAKHSLVRENSIVNAKDLVKDDNELKLFAPLGCGIQTGAGTILKAGQANEMSYIVVLGLGGVGLSAIMGGKIAGSKIIIGVDRVASRLELAKSLGATHVLDTSKEGFDLTKEVMEITGDEGASLAIDTTGVPALLNLGVGLLGKGGKFYLVGIPPMDFSIDVLAISLLSPSKSISGCIEGDVDPQKFIPQMIQWYRDGKFPIDKLVTMMPAEKFGEALGGMHSGACIKPVLTW